MEAARTAETLVNFYEIAGRKIPESNRVHIRRRENQKSQSSVSIFS
jgi:hypothetical protein